MILFPLGNPIFSSLGPAGISIFYVSTIIAQVTFSFGSIFRGGVGSELVCSTLSLLPIPSINHRVDRGCPIFPQYGSHYRVHRGSG